MASPHLQKVAAGMREIQERGQMADRLLKEGEHVVEIDPDLVLNSAISERFEDLAHSTSVAEIAESIRLRGQIVPGLVRPHPERAGYFQIVYGRRRLAAARLLKLRFRATIRDLTDEQAVIFQGEENTNRDDLSFIEKCAFALAQEKAGFSRDVISASLSTGKSHISEMLRVAGIVPGDILLRIGPAKEIGRRRWVEFAEAWAAHEDGRRRADVTLVPSQNGLPSEEKFARVLAALKTRPGPVSEPARPAENTRRVVSKGITLAVLSHARGGSTLKFEKGVPAGFVDFMASRIESLHYEYISGENAGKTTGD